MAKNVNDFENAINKKNTKKDPTKNLNGGLCDKKMYQTYPTYLFK